MTDLPKVSDIIEAVRGLAEPELAAFIDGLCPIRASIPLDTLLRLAESAALAIEAKNELGEMRAAVVASDATLDAAEEEALKAPKWP